jgi:hypothetical protein
MLVQIRTGYTWAYDIPCGTTTMPTVNPAITSPVSHPTSAKIVVKKVSKKGVERQTVTANPGDNGKQA